MGGDCFNNVCNGLGNSISFWTRTGETTVFFNTEFGTASVFASGIIGNGEYYVRCVQDN